MTFGKEMKILRNSLIVASGASLLLFGANVVGKNIFLYIGGLDKTLVVAASQGVCHVALTTEETGVTSIDNELFGDYPSLDVGYHELINWGVISLFSESRLDPLSPFRFDRTRGDNAYDYSAIEFPWLLIPLVLLGTLVAIRPKTKQAEQVGDGDAEEDL